mmetsp:Transcript_36746/g.93939  ORF Transcript_36746/g.93939 Transcript_36746/m.93939 type:complete len:305 (-) Transcript_36746:148-1062(-)
MSSSDIPPRALPLERAIASWYDSEPLARRLSAYAANPSPLLLRWGRRVLERREPLWRPSRGLVSAGSSARASCVRSSTTSALAAASSPSFCASSSSCRQPCSPPAACSSCRSSSTCVTRCCSSSLVALSSAVRSSTLSCRSAASSSRPNSYSLSLIRRLPRPSSRSAASCRSSSSSRCCASTSSARRRSSASVVLVLACSSSERFFSISASVVLSSSMRLVSSSSLASSRACRSYSSESVARRNHSRSFLPTFACICRIFSSFSSSSASRPRCLTSAASSFILRASLRKCSGAPWRCELKKWSV